MKKQKVNLSNDIACYDVTGQIKDSILNNFIDHIKQYPQDCYQVAKQAFYQCHRKGSSILANVIFAFIPTLMRGSATKNTFYIMLYGPYYGVYSSDDKVIKLALDRVDPTYKDFNYRNIKRHLESLDLQCRKVDYNMTHKFHWIPFSNGIYDIDTSKLMAFSKKRFITVKLPYNFISHKEWLKEKDTPIYKILGGVNPQTYHISKYLLNQTVLNFIKNFFNTISNKDENMKMQLFAESMDFYEPYASFGKYVFNIGNGSNGKSIWFDFISAQVAGLISGISVDHLNAKTVSSFRNTFGNFCADADDNPYVKNDEYFKKVATGDPVETKKLYQNIHLENFKSANIQNTNTLIKFKNRSKPILSRILYVYFPHQYDQDEHTIPREILDKIFNSNIFRQVYARWLLINHGDIDSYPVTKKSKELLQFYKNNGDPIKTFASYLRKFRVNRFPLTQLFKAFELWCENNHISQYSRMDFERNFIKDTDYYKSRLQFNQNQIHMDNEVLNELDIGYHINLSRFINTQHRCWVCDKYDKYNHTKLRTRLHASQGRNKSHIINRKHSTYEILPKDTPTPFD